MTNQKGFSAVAGIILGLIILATGIPSGARIVKVIADQPK